MRNQKNKEQREMDTAPERISTSQPSLVSIRDYGSVRVQIREFMEAKNMKRGTLARSINTRFEVVDKWYNGDVDRIDADILARMCFVLECEPGDLIQYKKPEKTQTSKEAELS